MKKFMITALFLVCAAIVSTTPASATVLWNNGEFVTQTGVGGGGADVSELQFIGLGMFSSLLFNVDISEGNLIADDFTVDGGVWDVTRITVYGWQAGSTTVTTISDFRFQILDGPPDDVNSNVVFGSLSNVYSGSDWSNAYRVVDSLLTFTGHPIKRIYSDFTPGTLLLPPGNYWLVWQVDGSLGGSTYSSPVSILGQTDTGNAKHYTGGAWTDAVDLPNTAQQGIPFLIEGSKVANFSLTTGTVNIPVVTIDGATKRYQVEMQRTPGTLEFTVINSNKLP